VLRFFGDVSGRQEGEFLVVAGYLGNQSQWKRFEHEWQLALAEAGAGSFHATDFFNFRGDFQGWDHDRARHNRFAKRFTAIAESKTECAVGRGVHVPAFVKLIQLSVSSNGSNMPIWSSNPGPVIS